MIETLSVWTGVVFLGEMGDKTQIATLMLVARYDSLVWVTVGTTLGMMLANVPAVLFGDRVVKWVPLAWVHRVAAIVFVVLGVLILLGPGFARVGGPGSNRVAARWPLPVVTARTRGPIAYLPLLLPAAAHQRGHLCIKG
jgi:hypothetical protein